MEIANAIEVVQDGHIYIELVNGRFLSEGGTPDQFRAGIARGVEANNLQQSWRFDWEPPKAVLRDVWTIDWILGC